jgi:hypothetical protein
MTPADDLLLDWFLSDQRRKDTIRAICRPTQAQLTDIERRFTLAQLAAEEDDGPGGVVGRLQ